MASAFSSRRVIATLTAAAVSTSAMVVPPAVVPHATAQDTGSRFTLGVLPDTQFYSRYSTPETGNLAKQRYGSEPFQAQTEWLTKNQDALNMAFATHLGDVVDQPDVEGEWKVADQAMKTLDDSSLNYSVLPGNHDMDEAGAVHPFNQWFPASRAEAANETFQDRHTGINSDAEYHIFEAEGQEYLVLALPWRAEQSVIDWAQKAIDAHPDLPVILTSHEILGIDGAGDVHFSEEYGQNLWDSFISKNDQIFLTMGGHHHGAGYRVDKNDYGHDVISILQDYQMAYQGGNGLLGVLEFDLTGNEIEMAAMSPWVAQKPAEELTQFDKLILDGEGDSYKVPLNFAERFESFAPDWKAGSVDEGDLAGQAREIISQGYTPYQISEDRLPTYPEDFIAAENTAFHWRPGHATDAAGKRLTDGQAAGSGSIIPEVFGNKDHLVRDAGADDRIVYSSEHHPLSSDEGSLYWVNPAGKNGVADFKTSKDAAVNNVDTTKGYTFESFVKLPADFNGSEHGWGNALARESSIADLVDGSDDTDPTVMFGVSNLRELRWWAEPKDGSGSTVWSHEVPTDEWMHIAVVNKPDTDTVEMFINGAPILRNAAGAEGLLPRELRWVMGSGYSDLEPQDPWYGWIGETRLTHGVLAEDQWLTARNPEATNPTAPADSSDGTSSSGSSDSSAGSSTGSALVALMATIIGLGGAAYLNYPRIKAFAKKLGIKLPRLPKPSRRR